MTARSLGEKPKFEDFTIERLIGEGNFSKVFKATFKNDRKTYALKVVDLQRATKLAKEKELLMEKHCLIKLNPDSYRDQTRRSFSGEVLGENPVKHHGAEHIIKLYHTFKGMSELYFVDELCEGDELWESVKGCGIIDDNSFRYVAGQVICAVDFVHQMRIVHRDIKAENLVYDSSQHALKFVDFGTAMDLTLPPDETLAGNSRGHTGLRKSQEARAFRYFVGTPNFMAPEARSNIANETCAPDIWSLGCTLYQIATGGAPFAAPSDFLVFVRAGKLALDIPCYLSPELEAAIRAMLKEKPEDRPAASQIWDLPFFKPLNGKCPCEYPQSEGLPPALKLAHNAVRSRWSFLVKLMAEEVEKAEGLRVGKPKSEEDERGAPEPSRGSAASPRVEKQSTETKPALCDPSPDPAWISFMWPRRTALTVGSDATDALLPGWNRHLISPGGAAWIESWFRIRKGIRSTREERVARLRKNYQSPFGVGAITDPASEQVPVSDQHVDNCATCLLEADDDDAIATTMNTYGPETKLLLELFARLAFDALRIKSTGDRDDGYYNALANEWLGERGASMPDAKTYEVLSDSEENNAARGKAHVSKS